MRVPEKLANAFGAEFEALLEEFGVRQKWFSQASDLRSPRFLSRSVVPHVERLSSLFNREESSPEEGVPAYWGSGSNPANLRLAYFLSFMPCNLFRTAAVWAELARLGFRWPYEKDFSAIEFGAGPAAGTCGIAAAEKYSPVGLPSRGRWALIEQDKPVLQLGIEWASEYFRFLGEVQWDLRPFHRKIDWSQPLLPRNAPRFQLWLMSFFLNESEESPEALARRLLDGWDRHLEDEGMAILVEPALRLQSRRLLEIRREIVKRGQGKYRILLPCFGEQSCGALADAEDWCHEEVAWWRPPYLRQIDALAKLDRKTLPFSYLVVAKSGKTVDELLPKIAVAPAEQRYRLVSPAHHPNSQCADYEFYLCGQDGKRRARLNPKQLLRENEDPRLERGDVLLGADIRGDVHASRVQALKTIG